MTRDDVIRMAQLAGFSPPVSADGYMGLAYDDNLQRFAAAAYAAGQVAEREARKAAQLETIALREELTKRAMQAEKEAYRRGVLYEREACADICDWLLNNKSTGGGWADAVGGASVRIRSRNNQGQPTMNATTLLNRAAELLEERGKQYEKPTGERSMAKTVAAFNAVTGRDLTEREGWEFMLVLKQVRLFQTDKHHQDSAEDAISYAALLAECSAEMSK